MDQRKLAFQRWAPGQILEPEHFRADEEAVVATACLIGELRGLPFYGIGRLVWNEAALAEGCISISRLTAVFPGGPLVDVPGNAVISDLDLTKIEAKQISIYLHMMSEQEPMPRSGSYEDDPRVVTRSRYRLRLSTEDALVGARFSLPLAVILHDKIAGPFRRSPAFAPPLLSMGNHPFLRETIDSLSETLGEIRRNFAEQFSDPMFRGEKLASTRFCEASAVRLQALLAERERGITPHPHVLFESMRGLWLDLLALHERGPDEIPLYEHDEPARIFDDLADRLRMLARGEPVRSPNLAFTREAEDQPFVAKPFPPALASASEVYLVVERSPTRTSLTGMKLSSPGRLDLVIRQSMHGIEVKHVPTVPFRHAFGPNVDFYQLDISTDEWKRAVDARAIAFRAVGALAKVRSTLYWRAHETVIAA